MSLRFGGEPNGVGRHRTVFEISGNRSAVTLALEKGERGTRLSRGHAVMVATPVFLPDVPDSRFAAQANWRSLDGERKRLESRHWIKGPYGSLRMPSLVTGSN